MSTDILITAVEKSGALKRFAPMRTRRPAKRRAFLTTKAHEDLFGRSSAAVALGGEGHIQAALMRWVLGDPIYKGFVKRLDPPPPEIWELRVTHPNSQWRAFFRFAAPDTIILTGIRSRGLLGNRGSAEWKRMMKECDDQWNALFNNNLKPFVSGGTSNDYVTENCDTFRV